jgi:hypothetical protein
MELAERPIEDRGRRSAPSEGRRLAPVIEAFRTRLSWQSFGALCVLFALNAVALILLLQAISSQQDAADVAQRARRRPRRARVSSDSSWTWRAGFAATS